VAPRAVESVSLIDEKKPHKKSDDGEIKKKAAILPPISRIRASLEAPVVTQPKVEKPAPPTKPEPVSSVAAASEETATQEPEAAEEAKNVIHIKPPIIVKQLA